MDKSRIISVIQQALGTMVSASRLQTFSANLRLNEDLYLDSVLVLELLIKLELEFGFDIPDSELRKEDFATVNTLADFLLRDCIDQPSAAPAEAFEDIKVHCFVSCLCESIKNHPEVDHRPFYFGVWDAEVVVTDNFELTYHSDRLNHNFFRHWYQRLYGVAVTPWYDPRQDKQHNIETLLTILDNKSPTTQVMVMLDMYRLPERENKFNQNPFPHYVMLENTENSRELIMLDPDFRWEGRLNKDRIIHAIASPAVAGGYLFDRSEIRPTSATAIYDYFQASFDPINHPLTDCVKRIIEAHTEPSRRDNPALNNLSQALAHLPVLAIRKYAYEHGFAFFWRALSLDDDEFEDWCDQVEELVSTYKKIQYRAMKIAQSPSPAAINPNLLAETHALINQQSRRETVIKARLQQVFERWAAIEIHQQSFVDRQLQEA